MKRLAFVLVAAPLVAGCPAEKPAEPVLSSSESWCPDDFEAGPSDTCFAIPDKHDKDTPILLYLHGPLQGRGDPATWKMVRGVTAKGFALVIARGRRDFCALAAGQENAFCWPSEPEDPQPMKNTVASWDKVLWQVGALLEPGTHRRYVLGYGGGGTFAAFVATHAMFPAQGWAFVDAGELAPAPRPSGKQPPMLLLVSSDQPDDVAKAKPLSDDLAKDGFPHASCGRAGPHDLSNDDLDAALRFFDHDAKGQLKVEPKTSTYPCEGATKPL